MIQVSDFSARPNCPACGASGREIFHRPYSDDLLRISLTNFYGVVGKLDYETLDGATYAVAECTGCRSYFQSQIPSDVLLGRLYEEWIDPEMARIRFHKGQPAYRSFLLAKEAMLSVAQLKPDAPRTALDYGCGWGEWSLITKGFGMESWATELSPSRRANAQQLAIRTVDEDELPDAYFGLINLDQVLEHMPNPEQCLRKLAEKLHPDGILRVAVPTAWRVANALKNFDREIARPGLGDLNAIAPLEHLNAFSQAGIVQLAAKVGLERVRPTWASLAQTTVFPSGWLAKIKAVLLPFYLRGRFTTQLYFRTKPAQTAELR